MFCVSREEFEAMVKEAMDALPEVLQDKMNNVVIVVQDSPTWNELQAVRAKPQNSLYGLYRGVPLTKRGSHYDRVLPDLITIYRSTHEMMCDSLEELRSQIHGTVRHEIAHHFGIDDERLKDIGAY